VKRKEGNGEEKLSAVRVDGWPCRRNQTPRHTVRPRFRSGGTFTTATFRPAKTLTPSRRTLPPPSSTPTTSAPSPSPPTATPTAFPRPSKTPSQAPALRSTTSLQVTLTRARAHAHALVTFFLTVWLSDSGVKDASDKKILVDMLLWAVDNPAPANYLLISGDRDFSNALHQLSMRRYNILLAHPPQFSPSLFAAAKVVWLWTALCAGGAPLYIVDSDSAKPPHQFKPKTKYVRKSTTKPPLPPLQIPDESRSINNDVPNPEPAQPPRKFVIGAPHEFFASKCSQPVNPIPIPTSSKLNNETSIPQDSRQQPPRQKLIEIPRAVNVVTTHPWDDSRASISHAEFNMEGLVDVILRTLNFLKVEMIVPNEANITDCIRYGDPLYQAIDVRKALDFAMSQRRVEKRVLGAMHLYLGRNEALWKCVNPAGGHPGDYPHETWYRVKQFLTSSKGRSLFLISRCRYTLVALKGWFTLIKCMPMASWSLITDALNLTFFN